MAKKSQNNSTNLTYARKDIGSNRVASLLKRIINKIKYQR